MKMVYSVRYDKIADEEGNEITVYGIIAENISNTPSVIEKSIPNIFTNEKIAKKFSELCNEEQLSLIHLECVIEDLLSL